MNKIITSFLSLFILVNYCFSQTIDSSTARRAALAWLITSPVYSGKETKYTPVTSLIEIKDSENKLVAYVMELTPIGYIIVSTENELEPIIAYSDNSKFSTIESQQNILLNFLRHDLHNRVNALKHGVVNKTARIAAKDKWNRYLNLVGANNKTLSKIVRTEWAINVGPFLKSLWNQDVDGAGQPAYNYYTPNHYVSGCVATALGQILKYYSWPHTGTNTYSYTWNNHSDPSSVLSADFGSTTYDWRNILIDYNSSRTEAERQAVGTLLYQCGVAVDMNYAAAGSGASISKLPYALQYYFRSEGEYISSTATDFYDRLYSNMLLSRPCELGIRNTSDGSGHAVVADGVQNEFTGPKYYHINYGWSGIDNNWYNLPALAEGYNTVDGAVINIIPALSMKNPGASNPKNYTVSWDSSKQLNAEKFELQESMMAVSSSSLSDGAETASGNWEFENYWQTTSLSKYTGGNSFRGYVHDLKISVMNLTRPIKVGPSTTISYYWGKYYFRSQEFRLEASTDGGNWTVLKSDTTSYFGSGNPLTWTHETSIDLSAYIGKTIYLRFVSLLRTGIYYDGITYNSVGFFIDDFNISDANISSQWSTIDNNITADSKSLTASANGEYFYRVRAFTDSRWSKWSDIAKTTVEDGSLAVEMGTMEASLNDNKGILVSWNTQTEDECFGFHIWRGKTPDDIFEKISSEIIPGHGTSSSVHNYMYLDNNLPGNNTYWYKIEEISTNGESKFYGPIRVTGSRSLPTEYALAQNYPNPFNPSTTIQYSIPVSQQSGAAIERFVTLKVYDILGNEVMTLVNENKQPGTYEIKFNAANLSSGVYLYRLSAGNFVSTKKMLFIR